MTEVTSQRDENRGRLTKSAAAKCESNFRWIAVADSSSGRIPGAIPHECESCDMPLNIQKSSFGWETEN